MPSDDNSRKFDGGGSAQLLAFVLALLGLVGWGIGLVVDTRQAMFSFLTAYIFLATILLGALAFLMTTFAARAEWPTVIRRLIESIVAINPILLVLFIPVLLGREYLYPWASGEMSPTTAEVVSHQGAWWSNSFFIIRAILYFVVWLGLTEVLRRWSILADTQDSERYRANCQKLSGIGLVLLAFTFSFAGFDWVMSLTPAWQSTVFGLYLFAGGFLTAFAVLIILMQKADEPLLLGGLLKPTHFLSLGKLLLTHVVFWVYIAYSQYFIIWIADVPSEVEWWIPRSKGWGAWSVSLVVVHFVIPFSILLSRSVKMRPRLLVKLSIWLIVAHYLDVYWLIMPALDVDMPRPHWLDVAAIMWVSGSAVWLGIWRMRGISLIPLQDPTLALSARYEGS